MVISSSQIAQGRRASSGVPSQPNYLHACLRGNDEQARLRHSCHGLLGSEVMDHLKCTLPVDSSVCLGFVGWAFCVDSEAEANPPVQSLLFEYLGISDFWKYRKDPKPDELARVLHPFWVYGVICESTNLQFCLMNLIVTWDARNQMRVFENVFNEIMCPPHIIVHIWGYCGHFSLRGLDLCC